MDQTQWITDFGAPIVAGPFPNHEEAAAFDKDNPDTDGVYYEATNDSWWCHGPHDGGPDIKLTTYN